MDTKAIKDLVPKKSNKALKALAAGVVLGTTLGMYLASGRGKKKAKKVKSKMKSLVSDLQDKGADLKEKVMDLKKKG